MTSFPAVKGKDQDGEFDVIGDITGSQTIATAPAFANLAVCVSAMVVDDGVSAKVSRKFAFHPAK